MNAPGAEGEAYREVWESWQSGFRRTRPDFIDWMNENVVDVTECPPTGAAPRLARLALAFRAPRSKLIRPGQGSGSKPGNTGDRQVSEDPAQQVLQVATGYMASAALYVALDLAIPDRLQGGAMTTAELAAATGANEGAVHRILRLLTSLQLFAEVAPRKYAPTPASALLCKGVPGSLREMAIFLPDPTHFRVYAELKESVMTGRPAADKTLGKPIFEYLAEHPEYSEVFNDAMTALSAVPWSPRTGVA